MFTEKENLEEQVNGHHFVLLLKSSIAKPLEVPICIPLGPISQKKKKKKKGRGEHLGFLEIPVLSPRDELLSRQFRFPATK